MAPANKKLSALPLSGITVAILGLALNLLILRPGASATPAASDQFYRLCAAISTPLDLLLLTASAAALLSHPRPRLLRLWAVLALLYAITRLVLAITVVAPATTAEARAALAGKPPTEFAPDFAGMMTTAIAAAVFVLTCILPTCILATSREKRTPMHAEANSPQPV